MRLTYLNVRSKYIRLRYRRQANLSLRTGIRVPLNRCSSRSQFGLCLGNPELIDMKLTTKKKRTHPAFGSELGERIIFNWSFS